MVVNCDICRKDISKFFGKTPMGICESCHVKICPKCMRSTKNCPKCGNKLFKTKSMMKEVPQDWKTKPCPSCGKKLNLEARFCDGCGNSLIQNFQPTSNGSFKNKVIIGLVFIILIIILFIVLESNA